MRIAFLIPVSLLLCAGCSLPRLHHDTNPNGLAYNPQLGGLERANVLRLQGDYTNAVIVYKNVVACAEDDMMREEARIGLAKSLVKMHKYPAALASLGSLPVDPYSEIESRKLAVAGEIYLRQKMPKEAETCLEIALENCPLELLVARTTNCQKKKPSAPKTASNQVALASHNEPMDLDLTPDSFEIIPPGDQIDGPLPDAYGYDAPTPGCPNVLTPEAGATAPVWIAGCCANLGCAYLKNDKPEKASVMYGFAARFCRLHGNHIAAERAQRVCDDLNNVLRQYAPYKPPPLTQHTCPGKK